MPRPLPGAPPLPYPPAQRSREAAAVHSPLIVTERGERGPPTGTGPPTHRGVAAPAPGQHRPRPGQGTGSPGRSSRAWSWLWGMAAVGGRSVQGRGGTRGALGPPPR